MIDREKLLEIAGSKHARVIYRHIKETEGVTHYNELCRELEFPSATVNKYLKLMEEANVIKRKWKRKDVSEELKSSKTHRHRKIWVRSVDILKTNEARIFDLMIYGD